MGAAAVQVTYSTLIDGWVKAGAVERASQLLQEMRRQGLKPNAITYNTLLKGYCSVTPASLPVRHAVTLPPDAGSPQPPNFWSPRFPPILGF